MRAFLRLAAALAGLLLFAASPAVADPPAVETDIVKNETITFEDDVNPCTGVPGTSTVTFNAVFHITDQGSSEGLFIYHVSSVLTGTVTFVPDDPAEPSYTGHFVSRSSTQATPPGLGFVDNFTFTVTARGTDGSLLTFRVRSQFTRLPSGEVVVDFFRVTCA